MKEEKSNKKMKQEHHTDIPITRSTTRAIQDAIEDDDYTDEIDYITWKSGIDTPHNVTLYGMGTSITTIQTKPGKGGSGVNHMVDAVGSMSYACMCRCTMMMYVVLMLHVMSYLV